MNQCHSAPAVHQPFLYGRMGTEPRMKVLHDGNCRQPPRRPGRNPRRQLQFMPQTPLTAATQVSSHAVMQQVGWTPQIASTQLGLNGGASQPDKSAEPSEQSVCEQLPALSSQSRLSQIVRTRWIHELFQEKLQQVG